MLGAPSIVPEGGWRVWSPRVRGSSNVKIQDLLLTLNQCAYPTGLRYFQTGVLL